MNKNMLYRLLACCLISIPFMHCDKDTRDINLNLTEVKNLFTPVDGEYILLDPPSNQVVTFEWEQAYAEDGSLVLYEVAFDQENGDFSQPFYKVVSDNKGIQNKLTISHGDLNKIAALGGAGFMERKKFRWTVIASKGTNVKMSPVSRIIDLERPSGFDVIPGQLYLSGSATEAGDVLAAALPMKQIEPGVFEIYTKLTAGTYAFYDAISGTPTQYHTFEDNGVHKLGIGNSVTFSGPDKVMRIRVDFNNINASYAEVKSIQLWYCAGNTFWFTLPYIGDGVWRYNNHVVDYVSMPWGFEERHKYKMVLNDGSGDVDHWLNYATNDSPGQDGQYPHTQEYRTINFDANNGSQWDWSWKWDRNYLTNGSTADFWVSLRATDPSYTVNYEKH